ncbi:MptD family putative ECF transporter S component [Bifidobacterium jacchi]|uniref:Trep_Strep domain-containing protein n=1 Tax=Bifidobacterium jacchi TaxID=2490545 RepID=A0A5N5RLT0_9BIFI|nr:MptD family putative ECF transporter S component [Bifidobacterium jacchi]KAB5607909.1 Trep_Strep domain-containing protein [Bifidobacterium jacchi]
MATNRPASASSKSSKSSKSSNTAANPAKSTKLTVPDLISIGVFTALYFVCVCVATLISTLVAGAGTIFLPAVAALICGPVFMLAVARIGKFGAITVMGIVIGLFLFVSGHFVLSFVASLIFPVLGDLIARIGRYKNRVTILIGYVVFCYGLTGPILPLWFMKDAYVASLKARGKDAAYIDNLFSQISTGSFFLAMGAILVCALVGGWFGQRLLKKHFVKAGIA